MNGFKTELIQVESIQTEQSLILNYLSDKYNFDLDII